MCIYVCVDFDSLQKNDFRRLQIKYIYLIFKISLIRVNIPNTWGRGGGYQVTFSVYMLSIDVNLYMYQMPQRV